MPANLTPDYERAERRYREAGTDEDRLDALQEMLRTIPKHKGTEKLQADIKRRISQLRKSEAKRGPAKSFDPYHIPKSGAGQVVLVGPPNSGKSSIAAATTHAAVKIADYPFTTGIPAPGMAMHEDVPIQLIDTPPIMDGHVPGGLMGTIRFGDVIAIVVDLATDALEQTDEILELFAAREFTVRSVPRGELETGQHEQYSGIIAANKVDLAPLENLEALRELYEGRLEVCAVSAVTGEGLEVMLRRFWELLGCVRVYTKHPGKPPDHDNPFTLPIGATVEDLAREIHRELPEKMKFARIWGQVRFDGQQVHRTEVLHDKDVVEIHE